jgi:non-specific serine/threonine protein kinase
VFRGSWTSAEAAAVCELAETPAGLDRLVAASLVTTDAEARRYGMLETIRQYAWDRLAEAGEQERLRTRHLAAFVVVAEEAEPQVMSPARATWIARLDRDHDNLRAALEWSCQRDPAAGRRLAGALGWFWYFGDHLNEGHAWCARLLAEPAPPDIATARLFCRGGMLGANLGVSDEARAWLESGLELAVALEDRALQAEAVFHLGYVLVQLGRDAEACALIEEYHPRVRAAAHPLALGWMLSYWGRALPHAGGDERAAKQLHDASVAVGERAGDPSILATAYMNLGLWAAEQGDYDAAAGYHRESLTRRREGGSRLNVAISAHYLADMLSMAGRYDEAEPLYAESLAISRALGDQSFIAWTAYRLGYVTIHRGERRRAGELLAESIEL